MVSSGDLIELEHRHFTEPGIVLTQQKASSRSLCVQNFPAAVENKRWQELRDLDKRVFPLLLSPPAERGGACRAGTSGLLNRGRAPPNTPEK